jgi:O-antigen/teichoic acid export membrane protein
MIPDSSVLGSDESSAINYFSFSFRIYTNLSVWYKLIDKTYIDTYISIVGAMITLALNFLLIPTMSYYYGSAI